MNARDALAIEVHRPRRKLDIDERVAYIAVMLLALAYAYGAKEPAPQVVSCYQSSVRP